MQPVGRGWPTAEFPEGIARGRARRGRDLKIERQESLEKSEAYKAPIASLDTAEQEADILSARRSVVEEPPPVLLAALESPKSAGASGNDRERFERLSPSTPTANNQTPKKTKTGTRSNGGPSRRPQK